MILSTAASRRAVGEGLAPPAPDGTLDATHYILALDIVGAGVGQTVLVEDEGNSARQILGAEGS